MTVHQNKAVDMWRIILAIDASEASPKAVSFVLTKFQPNRSVSQYRQPVHVKVIHVMARRSLDQIGTKGKG